MAKKSSTIYLEQKFWELITNYQKNNDLSSRNDALQLILQEWDILRKIDFNNIKINVATESTAEKVSNASNFKIIDNKKVIESEDYEENKIDPRVTNSLFQIANTMKIEE